MGSKPSDSHNRRNFLICSLVSFILFLIGSLHFLSYLVTYAVRPGSAQLALTALELGLTSTIVVSLVAIPLGYAYMYFFGGFVSTKAIKLYLLITRGTHIVTSKVSELDAIRAGRGAKLTLKRQLTYFPIILAVVISFAIYLSKHRLPVVSSFAKTSDVLSLITGDYITLTVIGSLMVPVVALALPYLGGLRLRTIDTGPFHMTVLTLVVGVSGGFTLLYSIETQPTISLLTHWSLLFMGVCWCFAMGCSLAADPANRQIVRSVLSGKTSSRLISSRIWLQSAQGQFREV
ncbi:MAG TPA: hypothetical protein VNA15_05005 [Candidatus Angelobacter sp.]|nr:hypothetical protein [Candidatus Angelobacter sp.]